MTSDRLPMTCDIVRYRGKHGFHVVRAAVVTADIDTLDPAGVRSGAMPALDSPQHVHLLVFTPGARGSFWEFNVPPGDGPGTWHWPPERS